MSPGFAAFTFLNCLWIMVFIALPFSVTYEEKAAEADNSQEYKAAPKSINWKKLFILDICLSVAVTLALKLIIG